MMTGARWDESKDRRVAEDVTGFYWLSSVFLGINMNFGWKGPPVLFETMVFRRETEIARRPRDVGISLLDVAGRGDVAAPPEDGLFAGGEPARA